MKDSYVQNNSWKYGDFIISSFDDQELFVVQDLNNNIRISENINTSVDFYEAINKNIILWSINLEKGLISKQYVDDAHKRGIKVYAWTVDNQDEIDLVKNFDIDGIISNFPDRI